MKILYVLFLFVLLQTNLRAFAQDTSFPIDEWVKKVNAEKDVDNKDFISISNQLFRNDSVVAHNAINELEKSLASGNLFFKARFHCLKAIEQFIYNYSKGKPEVKKLFEQALKEAYATGDADVISYISWVYGKHMYGYREMELAATYALRAVEINPNFFKQGEGYLSASILGEILFHCREYEKCVFYTRWSIANWPDTSFSKDSYCTKLWNTVGQAYQNLGMMDSAMANYERSIVLANKTNVEVWKAINSGYEGQILFLRKEYKKAKPLFAYDYSINKNADLNIAANSLQWLAKINLIQGKKDSALWQAKEALSLLSRGDPKHMQKTNFLQQVYYTTADVYRSMGKTDSFYHYFQLYINLHDSLERVIARSSIDISQMRNDNEKNFYDIQVMQREKNAEVLKRNFIIAAIILLSVIVFLYLNSSRMKLRHKEQIAKAEIKAAGEQLRLITQNIVEKTILIEKLEQQVKANEYNAGQHQLIEELSHQTILTEDDWLKFKMLFEKTHPGFFTKLKEQVGDITLAEQRMAALTRLHLTTKQMAAVLGISPNSVIKAKQRLRQRFNFQTDFHVEEFLARL